MIEAYSATASAGCIGLARKAAAESKKN